MLLIVMVLMAAAAGIATAAETPDALAPDAAVIARPLDGSDAISGASWTVAEIARRRVWFDWLQPLDAWGAGISVDLSPGAAAAIGGGCARGWKVYIAVHAPL